MRVRITITIDVDEDAWMLEYGVAKSNIRRDVRNYIQYGLADSNDMFRVVRVG